MSSDRVTPKPTFSTDHELLDFVDAEDRVIGQATRAEIHAQRRFHRAIHLFVFHPDGRLFLQKRSRWKDTGAGTWSTSCAGHVDQGESYDGAVLREAGEELGIRLTEVPERFGRFTPAPELGYEFLVLYRVVHPGPFTWPEAEIEDGRWWTLDAIREASRETPETLAGSFRYLFARLFP